MTNRDILHFGRNSDVSERLTARKRVQITEHVNTSFCKYSHHIRCKLTDTLSRKEHTMTALEWYDIACSEEGPSTEQLEMLGTFSHETQSFDKGGFAEFRLMRVLEELQQGNVIDDFMTDYQLPVVKTITGRTHRSLQFILDAVRNGESLNLDPLKIDALAYKQTDDGKHLYLPLQVKFQRGHSRRHGNIALTQKDAAQLRRQFSELKDCFDTLKKPMQILSTHYDYHIVYPTKKDASGATAHPPLESRTKTELKEEITAMISDEDKTFTLEEAIDQYWGLPLLRKLFAAKLLRGARTTH